MNKLFVVLLILIVAILIGGCQSLSAIFPFLDKEPIIISEPVITATEGNLYLYELKAIDPEGNVLSYFLNIYPEGMSINSENGLISWSPNNSQVGIHQVEVEISDGRKSVPQSFEIEVFNVNNPPKIISYSPVNLNININEGDSIKFEIQARDIDVDSSTSLSYQWLLNGKKVSGFTVLGEGSKSSWIYSAGYGNYSQKIVKVLVSDGELQNNVQWNITINDITPPGQPTLNNVTSPTNISSQILSGTKDTNSSILINNREVVSINSSTDWSYLYNLSEGTNNISVTSRDAAGNESLSITTNIILDTISPMVPTLNSIISPTNISTQILCGTKEAETSILINGAEVIPINSETTWSYSLYLTEGTNSIFITSCDAVGNESAAVNITIVLDISTPEIPTLDAIVSPTNISPQILSGTKEANTSIRVNGVEAVPLDTSTKWSYPFTLIEDENNISITSCNAVGNESAAVNNSITLDTISPTTPTLHDIISPTNICTQLLSGNKETNSSIWVNGVEVISVNSETTWTYDFELTEGENSILIISKDTVGNESNEVNTIIILDISTPAIPSLKTVASPTNISSQILSGTKDTNSSILINNTEVVSINSSTDWSYLYNLSEGTNNISVASRDASGNESLSITTNIILDTASPMVPTLNSIISPTNISAQILCGTKEAETSILINGTEVIPINSETTWSYSLYLTEGTNSIFITSCDAVGNESAAVNITIVLDISTPEIPTLDAIVSPTNISPQILSGTKEANTSIRVNGVEAVPLDTSTKWSYPFTLIEDENNISITSCNAVGNESAAVNNSITLDTISPTTPTLHDIISPTNICTQLLSGNKETNSSIWVNGVEVISVNSETTWTYDFELTEGENSILIISKDTVGNESNEVNTIIILDISTPAIPSLKTVASPTNISSQILSGTKDTNSSILINGVEVISLDSSTEWSHSYNLSEGTNNISVTSRDAAGNESSGVTATIEYDPNIYVNAANATGIEDGTQTHPFDTITEGIEAAIDGKSVIVASGIYNEQIIINKGIALQGAGKESTFISGSGFNGNLITIAADNVTISEFSIDGVNSTGIGIYINNYSTIIIKNNLIKTNKDYGIKYCDSNSTIQNNIIESNGSSGIDIGDGSSGIIENNFITCNNYGIRTCGDSSPKITNNNITSNSNSGIYCRESATPLIAYNTIINNSYGILIDYNSTWGALVNPDIGGGDRGSKGNNKISGNSIHGVSNKTTHNIYAENNWWGDSAGPKYPGNSSSSGDWIYWSETGGNIIFNPYLKAEP